MSLVTLPEEKSAEAIEHLTKYLIAISKNSKDSLDTIQELRSYEYISEDQYKRMVQHEFIGLIKEVQGYLDIYLLQN